MLSKQLKSQIAAEAKQRANCATNILTAFYIKSEYKAGAERYAEKWEAAEARAERAEKALREIKEKARYPKNENESGVAIYNILKLCEQALTPKTSDDD